MPRILIVDDEPDMRLAIKNVLRMRGYEIAEASDGPTAINLFEKNGIDLVLLDIRLPGMDGIEVLEKLRKINRKIPVVMITGYGHIQSVVDVMKLGANEYLQKPFENTQLVDVIKKMLVGEIKSEKKTPRPAEPVAAQAPQPAPAKFWINRKIWVPAFAGILFLIYAGLTNINWPHRKTYNIESSNISSLVWHNDELWGGDWVTQSIYRYSMKNGAIVLKNKYELGDVHITGFAFGKDKLYVLDSWKKIIQVRGLDDKLSVIGDFDFPEKAVSISFDGKYLWSLDSGGNVLLHNPNQEFEAAAYFKLSVPGDLIFKEGKNLWSAVSSQRIIYRHGLDDKLSVQKTYRIKISSADRPLSAFTWRKNKLWLAHDGSSEITEISPYYLETIR